MRRVMMRRRRDEYEDEIDTDVGFYCIWHFPELCSKAFELEIYFPFLVIIGHIPSARLISIARGTTRSLVGRMVSFMLLAYTSAKQRQVYI